MGRKEINSVPLVEGHLQWLISRRQNGIHFNTLQVPESRVCSLGTNYSFGTLLGDREAKPDELAVTRTRTKRFRNEERSQQDTDNQKKKMISGPMTSECIFDSITLRVTAANQH